jgi:hypothetical protein
MFSALILNDPFDFSPPFSGMWIGLCSSGFSLNLGVSFLELPLDIDRSLNSRAEDRDA